MTIVERRKQIKKNNIINVIRENDEVSRYVLKKKTKYSMTTILNSVLTLIDEGLIYEEESTQKNVGRTPVYLKLNSKGRYFIGLEFNAENLKVALVNFAIEFEYTKLYKMPKNASVEEVLDLLKEAIRSVLDVVKDKSKVEGIGIGIPGFVDKHKGLALQYSYFKNWNSVDVKGIMEKEFGYEVYIDNNINAMSYHYRFEHREKSNFIIVSMQYGVRLGIVLDGKIFIGNNGNAGEIGHTKVIDGKRECSCGKTGCLDSEISYLAIEGKVKEYIDDGRMKNIAGLIKSNNGKFTMEMLGQALLSGDPEAKELQRNITNHLGKKLATVISVIDIEDIIILNVCDLDNKVFADQVYHTIVENSIDALSSSVSVSCEIVDSFAAAKGAALMIVDEKYGFIKE